MYYLVSRSKHLFSEVIKLKHKLKNIFLFLLIALFSFAPIFKISAFKDENEFSKMSLLSSSNEKNGSENAAEDSDVFEFIKDKKNSIKDFFYDGSALLYGGILLIIISVFGIFKTLKPKKRRKNRGSNKPKTNSRR